MEKTKKTKNQKTSSNKKKSLGRGMGQLLGVTDEQLAEVRLGSKKPSQVDLKSPKNDADPLKMIHTISIENIRPNAEQPRKVFNEEALLELTSSIKEQGIMQPIVAQEVSKGKFEIIAGERRWRAAQRAGLKEVPIILKDVDPQNKLELAIIENIQRDDLNPIEEGEAYLLLAKKYNLTQKEIAQKVGKDRATVANLIRITGLSDKVKEKVTLSKISLGHAKVLLAVEDPKLQLQLSQKVERLNLSVRATESMVKNALDPDEEIEEIDDNGYSSAFKDVEDQLKRLYGTRLKIKGSGGKVRVEMSFHNMEQFNDLIDKLLR